MELQVIHLERVIPFLFIAFVCGNVIFAYGSDLLSLLSILADEFGILPPSLIEREDGAFFIAIASVNG